MAEPAVMAVGLLNPVGGYGQCYVILARTEAGASDVVITVSSLFITVLHLCYLTLDWPSSMCLHILLRVLILLVSLFHAYLSIYPCR